jgi:hypothetical protein
MDSEKNTMVDIRDYLLNGQQPLPRTATDSPYTVLLQTACDFIIARKKGKSEKELVILLSEELFYFKSKAGIEEVTESRLKAFLRDLGNDFITLDQVLWLQQLDSDAIRHLLGIINNKTSIAMARANVLSDECYRYDNARYFEQNPDLYAEIHSHIYQIGATNYRSGMATAFEIEKEFDYDSAIFFAEIFKNSGIRSFTSSRYYHQYNNMEGLFQLLGEPYNLNLRRLIEYVLIDSVMQGITDIDSNFWRMYYNYLDMQIKVHGEILEKYPPYLKTAADIMTLNVGIIDGNKGVAEQPEEVTALAHKGKTYSIVVPDSPQQIAEEGINLSHCLGANADKHGSHVIFMRKSKEPAQSLMTLLFANGRISKAAGLHRRTLNSDERKFLEDWGSENGIEIAA